MRCEGGVWHLRRKSGLPGSQLFAKGGCLMHKRILVPMDDSAFAEASVPEAQSPSIADRVTKAWKAETWISLSWAGYQNHQSPFNTRKSLSRYSSGGRRRDQSQYDRHIPKWLFRQAARAMYRCLQRAPIQALLICQGSEKVEVSNTLVSWRIHPLRIRHKTKGDNHVCCT